MNETWRVVHRSSDDRLRSLLSREEPLSTSMSERLRTERLDPRLRRGGRFYAFAGDTAVYQGLGGTFYPLGLDRIHGENNLVTALAGHVEGGTAVRTIIGSSRDVQVLQGILQRIPPKNRRYAVEYDLLALAQPGPPEVGDPPDRELQIIQPSPSQWRQLLSLQLAYEVEEVLMPGREPVPAYSRAHLIESLRNQLVLVGLWRGTVIARVSTNALGYRFGQIGGVYTDPAWRRRGVSRWLMSHLLRELYEQGRYASLFVKKSNPAAQALYRSMGFRFVSPFRISYYTRQ